MINEEVDLYLAEFDENLSKTVNYYADELLQFRAGRANPKLIERITVDYYGTMTPLSQMSTISVPEARMIMISVWDISQLRNVCKAIEAANLGLNPSDDGRVIRLIFPALTEERRKELVREINKLTENTKVTCRNFRRDVLDEFKKMKKDSSITEDEMDLLEKEVQKRLDATVAKLDTMQANKEKEIMEI